MVNSSVSTGQFQPDVVREIQISIRYLRHHGCWANARDRAELAILDWHREQRQRPLGAGFEADQLAKDVYDLLGVPLAMGRREALRVTTRTMAEAVRDELARCVNEDRAKLVSLPTRTFNRGRAAAARQA